MTISTEPCHAKESFTIQQKKKIKLDKCPQREGENKNVKFEETFSQPSFRKTIKEKVLFCCFVFVFKS